jgi:hypothetical protein
MTNPEFSIEFDILYNNISSNKAPGLNEYEKSVFLTKAQEQIVTELYSGRNTTYNSFEETEEQRRYLHSLITTSSLEESTEIDDIITSNSSVYKLPENIMFITYETAILTGNKEVTVYPVSQDELSKIIKNPFRGPSNNRVLRLDLGNNSIEVISNYDITKYLIRYIRKPNPIILVDLEDELSINGVAEESECELDSSLHRTILDRAVALALQTMYSK